MHLPRSSMFTGNSHHSYFNYSPERIRRKQMTMRNRVVSQLYLDTGMKIFLKIRGNIRGIFKEKRGNNIQFASNTGRKIKIENVYQLNFFGSVKNILILTENESKYGGTVIYNTIITHKTKLLWPDFSRF